jgi:hypothetical protein
VIHHIWPTGNVRDIVPVVLLSVSPSDLRNAFRSAVGAYANRPFETMIGRAFRQVYAILDLDEVLAHIFRGERIVPRQFGDEVPLSAV